METDRRNVTESDNLVPIAEDRRRGFYSCVDWRTCVICQQAKLIAVLGQADLHSLASELVFVVLVSSLQAQNPFSTNPSHLRFLLSTGLPSWQRDWTRPIMLIVLFLVSHFNFLFVPCGRLSWLPISFLLHVKYTVSYRSKCASEVTTKGGIEMRLLLLLLLPVKSRLHVGRYRAIYTKSSQSTDQRKLPRCSAAAALRINI